MKQMVLIALFALIQTSSPVPRKAANNASQKSQATQNKATTKQQQPDKAQSIQNLVNSQPNQQAAPSQAGQNENQPVIVRVLPVNVHKDWTDYLYIGTGLVLTLITFGIAIIAWTQAKAAKLSAEAAKLNAEAVINSQRAWVVASPWKLRPPLGFIPEPGDPLEAPGRDMPNIFYVLFNNVGASPAKITQTCVLYIAIEKLEMLPQEPKYSGVETHTGVFLFNRKYESGKDEKNGRVAHLWPNQVLTKETIQAITTQRMFLYAYGFVGYEDSFKRQHTMRFGYVYNFPQPGQPPLNGFMPAGPSKYNEAD